ncbi:TPR domain protein [Myriangium duriaei CBS 260.36]|uniref:TPR domain protein n=1 Tax=Myriangium duriaei CBS 260.36 TaxID=1168546 RepID=A0A9P4ITN5_9PEZI|nr:TPR domain protein [Myriangium duriaei CBS 260.36]
MLNKATSQIQKYNLGSYCRHVTTDSRDAQDWFDQGLIWSYGFNHQAAADCFENVITCDQDCAMAYWGLALALGPNYNKPWELFENEERRTAIARTHSTAVKALALAARVAPVERALIQALQHRYPSDVPGEGGSACNPQYADAMSLVYQDFPGDLDVAAIYADALMNITPWALWEIRTGQPAPGARTLEAKIVLDRALSTEKGKQHPGLLHLYIHLMEMSPTPEAALPIADHLRGLVPDAGHLHHMPSHLDVLCGDYRRAIASNSHAVRADEKYLANVGPMNFYSLYRCHNYHFRIYAAMFAGQSEVVLDTVAELEATIPEELLRVESPPMADWLEGFLAMRVHTLIRFGRWDDILDLKLPDDPALYCTTTAMTHYAKGIALAVKGDLDAAYQQRNLLGQAMSRVPSSRTLFNNTCADILAVAKTMLDGEFYYRQGNFDEAFKHLRQAIDLEDNLPYDEPWGWMQPTRHAYGALLLEQGGVEEAAAVYEADLGLNNTLPRALQHPNNLWALHGYHECLFRLGRLAEASVIKVQLKLAEAVADIKLTSSCFCRLTTVSDGHS